MNFLEYIEAYSNTGWDDIEAMTMGQGHSMNLPVPTFRLPTKQFTATVRRIKYNQNPIQIEFDNGVDWRVSKKQWDYLKSIGREPKENAVADVSMLSNGMITGFSPRSNPSPGTDTVQPQRKDSPALSRPRVRKPRQSPL